MERPSADGESSGPREPADYDAVISEAAVGSLRGVSIAVGAIHSEPEGYEVEIDIDKSRFETVREGSVFELADGVRARVVGIEYAKPPRKGKLFLAIVE